MNAQRHILRIVAAVLAVVLAVSMLGGVFFLLLGS